MQIQFKFFVISVYTYSLSPMGIWTPSTEFPSHSIRHTDCESSDPVVALGYAGTRRLIKVSTNKTTSALPGLKESFVTDISATAA